MKLERFFKENQFSLWLLLFLAVFLSFFDKFFWLTAGKSLPLKIQVFLWWGVATWLLKLPPKVSGMVGVFFLVATPIFLALGEKFAAEQSCFFAYLFFSFALLQSLVYHE